MSAIKHIDQFEQEIRCCRELAIPRFNDSYRHHVFVGRVDKKGCYLYHYESVSSGVEFPGQIRKVYLDFEKYRQDSSYKVRNIFNLDGENGVVVFIVKRNDYPKSEVAENECIKRAEMRLGEQSYCAVCNNCESYVNWIFSGDNTSKQAEESVTMNIVGNTIDGAKSRGIQRQVSQTQETLPVATKKIADKFESRFFPNLIDYLYPRAAASINSLKGNPKDIKSVLNSDIVKLNMAPKMHEAIGKTTLSWDVIKLGQPQNRIMYEEFQSRAQNHWIKSAVGKIKNKIVEKVQNLSFAFTFGIHSYFEISSLSKKLEDIKNDKHMTLDQKSRSEKREIGSSCGGLVGSYLGQTVFPCIGGHVGGLIGSAVGGVIGGTLVHSVSKFLKRFSFW